MPEEAEGGSQHWRDRVARLRTEVHALFLACRHPATPWYAKAVAGLVVAHTLSPIDLIPDFIPVLGYLDDLVVLPVGIWLALKLIPDRVMLECRQQARERLAGALRKTWWAGAVTLLIWTAAVIAIGWLVYRSTVRDPSYLQPGVKS